MCYKHSKTSPDSTKRIWEKLRVLRRKYVKPQSMATAKHKFQRPVFNIASQKVLDFPDEFQKLAEDAFGVGTQVIIEQFIYAKKPPDMEESITRRIWKKEAHIIRLRHI